MFDPCSNAENWQNHQSLKILIRWTPSIKSGNCCKNDGCTTSKSGDRPTGTSDHWPTIKAQRVKADHWPTSTGPSSMPTGACRRSPYPSSTFFSSLPIFHLSLAMRQAEHPHRTKPITHHPLELGSAASGAPASHQTNWRVPSTQHL